MTKKRKNKPYLVLLSNFYWVPLSHVDMDYVRLTFSLETTGFDGAETIIEVWKEVIFGGTTWIGLPRGRPDLASQALIGKNPVVADHRVDAPIQLPIEFQGKYRKFQKPAIRALVKSPNGVLKSKPRTGKTVMATGALLKIQQKTLILAHQTDLIEQFCNETINARKKKQLFDGRLHPGVAGICSTYEDFERHDICLATYQTFLSSKGQRLLSRIRRFFGLVIVDEVHRAPATRYFEILSQFPAKSVHGLTATDDRKDGKWPLSELLIGPVVFETEPDNVMTPRVYGVYTSMKPRNPQPKTWVGCENMLFRNNDRNVMIAKQAVKDAKKGHHVLIPVKRVAHAEVLSELINNLYGREVCFIFTARHVRKVDRQWARDEMNTNKKIRVTIAMRQMLTGMNVPRWSCEYTICPISNPPQYTQEVDRICTAMEGKPQPIVRYFYDRGVWCAATGFKKSHRVLKKYPMDQSFKDLVERHGGSKEWVPSDSVY